MSQIATDHTEAIHDAQLSWSGSRLATCSSDRTIKIYDCSSPATDSTSSNALSGQTNAGGAQQQQQQHTLIDTLHGHDGPVWQVSWAHPKFGNILASCSYDGKVIVWREGQTSGAGSWQKIKEHTLHNASVNSLAWAPHELGAILACASSDGKVSVLSFNNDGAWDASLFVAHPVGVNSISWAPACHPSSLVQPQRTAPNSAQPAQYVKKFATGGCDSVVKVWAWKEETKEWIEEETLDGHTDWVRDVAWAPNVGLPRTYLASASQDKTVNIHICDSTPNAQQTWSKLTLDPQSTGNASGSTFPDTVYRLSWSVSGAVLAVSCGDGRITLWKENVKGAFELVSDIQD